MTRQSNRSMFGGFFSNFGSVGRNMKRLAVVACLFFATGIEEVAAEEAQYKVKIHKTFMKEVLDKNFPVVLKHLESRQVKNTYLTDVNANLDEFTTKILPKQSGQWDEVKSDLFFDQGEIVMELENLEFVGKGMITDPETGIQERISMNVDMDLCQIVMRLETEVQDGYVYPKIELKDVAFTLNAKTFNIHGEGDLPLYKEHKFEEGVKTWLTKQLTAREREFFEELQRSEREIMQTFAFKKDIQFSGALGKVLPAKTAHSSLGEVMRLDGDHIVLEYLTEFEGTDLQYSSQTMRRMKVDFSDLAEHQRDVQVAIDENQINYYLFSLFHADKPISLTEKLLEMIPEWLEPGAFMVKAVMNAQTFSPFFPELKKYGSRRIDIRCNFDKQSLMDGNLEEQQMSHIRFKDDNKIEMDLHFGCSSWLYEDHIQIPAMEEFMNFILDLYDDDPDKWEKHRSFYVSMDAKMELDFSEGAKTMKIPAMDWVSNVAGQWSDKLKDIKFPKMSEHVPLIFGRIVEFEPRVHEVKVFKGQVEYRDEAESLNKAINDMRTHSFWENPVLQPVFELFFGHTIPVAPFPQVEGCLGLRPKDSQITISEGMAAMSFDYKVDPSSTKCLFEMQESKLKKEARRLERYNKSPMGVVNRKMEKLFKIADEKVLKKLDVPELLNHPHVKKIQKVVSDEKTQKAVKDGLKQASKVGEKLAKGWNNMFGKKKGSQPSIMNFIQNK